MQPASQDLLDDPARLEAADPGGMLRQVASAAAQVRYSLRATAETDFGALISDGRPRAIVVTGVGASGLAGEILAAVCGPGCPVQIVTVPGYTLPGWAGAADLVLAASCSGGAEETLAVAEDAVRRGCRLVGVGAPRSPLASLAEQARAPFVPVRATGPARSMLWALSVPLVGVAARLGLCQAGEAEHEAAAAVLEEVSQRCRPDSEAFVNPAKEIALELAGTLPVIWGSTPLSGAAARRFASQLSANARYPALPGVLPEASHGQIGSFDGPFAPGPLGLFADPELDGGPAASLRLVMLADAGEHPRVRLRREVSVDLARDRGVGVTELAATGDHPLERLASLVQLIDYATVYLGLALGYDPSQVPAVDELSSRIS
jgi:Bacterial phospho-glucose isomerase C-terminal SIS domain